MHDIDCNDWDRPLQQRFDRSLRQKQLLLDNRCTDIMAINDVPQCDDENDVEDGVDVQMNDGLTNELILQY
jgi:hypothetical protein